MLEISIDMRKTNAYNKSVNCLRIYHTINCASRQERARQQHIGGGSMAERYTKTYVSVNVDIDEDGTMLPRLIRWMNGRVLDEGGGRRHPLYRSDKRPRDLPVSGGQPVVRGGQGLRLSKNFVFPTICVSS